MSNMRNLMELWNRCREVVSELLHGGYTGVDIEMTTLDQVFEEELKKVGEIANHEKVKVLLYNAFHLGKVAKLSEEPHKDYDIPNLIDELKITENNYLCKENWHQSKE